MKSGKSIFRSSRNNSVGPSLVIYCSRGLNASLRIFYHSFSFIYINTAIFLAFVKNNLNWFTFFFRPTSLSKHHNASILQALANSNPTAIFTAIGYPQVMVTGQIFQFYPMCDNRFEYPDDSNYVSKWINTARDNIAWEYVDMRQKQNNVILILFFRVRQNK